MSALKAANYTQNFDRICTLESILNDLSEKYISDRLSNFIKTDVLNSEKMTPHFLRLAETQNNVDLTAIMDQKGTPFICDNDRNDFITQFYEDLYQVPDGARSNFTGCVEEFLGDLINHPVIRGCMLSEEESTTLEAGLTIEELDEAVMKCNIKSAPGIDGISNNFIKKIWNYFRLPLHEYTTYSTEWCFDADFQNCSDKINPKKRRCFP